MTYVGTNGIGREPVGHGKARLIDAAADHSISAIYRTAFAAIVVATLCQLIVGMSLERPIAYGLAFAPLTIVGAWHLAPLRETFSFPDPKYVLPILLGWTSVSTCLLIPYATQTQFVLLVSNLIVVSSVTNLALFRDTVLMRIGVAAAFVPICFYLAASADSSHFFFAGILFFVSITQYIAFQNLSRLASHLKEESDQMQRIATQAIENLESAVTILHPYTLDIDRQGRIAKVSPSLAELTFGTNNIPPDAGLKSILDVSEQQTASKLIKIHRCLERRHPFHARQLQFINAAGQQMECDLIGLPVAGVDDAIRLVLDPQKTAPAQPEPNDVLVSDLGDALGGTIWATNAYGQLTTIVGEQSDVRSAIQSSFRPCQGSPENALLAHLQRREPFRTQIGPLRDGRFAECRAVPKFGDDGIFQGFRGAAFIVDDVGTVATLPAGLRMPHPSAMR